MSLLLLLPVSAAGQENGDPRDAPLRWGPLYVTPSLHLRRLGVDTNVFNRQGEPEADFTVVVGPVVDLAVPMRRFLLELDTQADYVHYQRFENQRGFNLDTTLRASLDLLRVSLFVEDNYLNTRQRPNFEIDIRARREENAIRAGTQIRFYRRLELVLDGSHATRRYAGDSAAEDRLARSLNRDAVAGTALLRFRATPLTSLRVRVRSRDSTFERAPLRDNRTWSVVPGVDFNPRAIISGRAELGYRNLTGVSDALPDYSGPVASVDLTYRLLESSTLRFEAERDIRFSASTFEPYFVAKTLGARFRYQLTPTYAANLGAWQDQYDYRQFVTGAPGGEPTGGFDRTRRFSFILSRRLSRQTEAGVQVTHYSRQSNRSSAREYDGFLVGLDMSYAF